MHHNDVICIWHFRGFEMIFASNFSVWTSHEPCSSFWKYQECHIMSFTRERFEHFAHWKVQGKNMNVKKWRLMYCGVQVSQNYSWSNVNKRQVVTRLARLARLGPSQSGEPRVRCEVTSHRRDRLGWPDSWALPPVISSHAHTADTQHSRAIIRIGGKQFAYREKLR